MGAGALKLTAGEARRRFGTAAVARLATIGPAGRPHLVPVTFALDGDRIYTVVDAKPKTTTNLRRLRNIGADPRVTVLADHYEDDWDALWWARADGLATILSQPADMAGPLELLAARYPPVPGATAGRPADPDPGRALDRLGCVSPGERPPGTPRWRRARATPSRGLAPWWLGRPRTPGQLTPAGSRLSASCTACSGSSKSVISPDWKLA